MRRTKECPTDGCATMIQPNTKACQRHMVIKFKIPTSYSVVRSCASCGNSFQIRHSVQKACDECLNAPCIICGTRFKHVTWHQKTCSPQCARAFRFRAPMLTCERCGQPFKKRRGVVMKHCSQECRYLASRIDESTLSRKRRGLWAYKQWREAVFNRDNFTCQHCGATEGLHAHHIKEWRDYPELRYDVQNGLTLCFSCHSIVHGAKITPIGSKRKTCSACGIPVGQRNRTGFCHPCGIRHFHLSRSIAA